MSKALKTTLIVAGSLLMAGVLIFSLAAAFGGRLEQLWNENFWNVPWHISLGTNITGYKGWDNAYAENGDYAVNADGLSAVNLKWIAGDVTVGVYDGSEVTFVENSGDAVTQEYALRYGVENGVLYIQYCSTSAPNDLPEKSLVVKIPAALAADMSAFDFSGTSASLTISGLTTDDFDCASVSGRIEASDITAETVCAATTSGEVRFSGSYVYMNVDTVSGKVRIDSSAAAQETKVNTTSGSVELAGEIGTLTADTISGEVDSSGAVYAGTVDIDSASGAVAIQFGNCPDDLKINTVSGSVTLALPSDSGFTLKYDTVSGGMNCGFSVVMSGNKFISGDGAANFEIDTISGGLKIQAVQE